MDEEEAIQWLENCESIIRLKTTVGGEERLKGKWRLGIWGDEFYGDTIVEAVNNATKER